MLPAGLPGDWQQHPFVRAMSADSLATLAACAMPMTFEAGQMIFREGEIANRFYLILDGRGAIGSRGGGSARRAGGLRGAGMCSAGRGCFRHTRNFTARAVTPVKAIFFYGTWLRDQCEAEPALGYELMKRTAAVLIRRLQATRQQLVRATT